MTFEMKSEVKALSPVTKEVSVEVSQPVIAAELNKAYARLAQKVKLKGFRQGKVPRNILEQYYKPTVEKDVLEEIVTKSFHQVVADNKFIPVSTLKITASSEFKPDDVFSYTASFDIRPKVELTKWEGLEITATAVTVTENDVDFELEELRDAHCTFVPVLDRDVVEYADIIDVGVSVTAGGTQSNTRLNVGDELPKELEKLLIGKKVGEEFFLEERNLFLTVTGIKSKKLPTIDDEFAKDVSEKYASLNALRDDIKTSLQQAKVLRDKKSREEAIAKALVDSNPFELPTSMIDDQAENMASSALTRMSKEKATEFWALHGTKLKEEARPRAIEILRSSLILEAIAENQGIVVSEEDIDNGFSEEAHKRNISRAKLLSQYTKDDIVNMRYRILIERALALVETKSIINCVEKPFRETN